MNAISSRPLRGLVCFAAAAAAVLTAVAASPAASAAPTTRPAPIARIIAPRLDPTVQNPTNPLANHPWGLLQRHHR